MIQLIEQKLATNGFYDYPYIVEFNQLGTEARKLAYSMRDWMFSSISEQCCFYDGTLNTGFKFAFKDKADAEKFLRHWE